MSRLPCLALLLSGCLISDEDLRGWADDTAGSTKDTVGSTKDTVQDIVNSMVQIPAQTFIMGCTAGQGEDCGTDEAPVTVTLSQGFLIGETEVTQAQWEGVMGDNPSRFDSCGSTCPVEKVPWHMAADFANAVSTAEGLDACYDCTGSGTSVDCDVGTNPYQCEGYRLPTEAEWEAAARCGEDTLYAGSDNADAVAWTSDNSGSTPHSVGAKSPNACGLYDMSGNVWEWTQDWYGSYQDDSTDPVGAQTGGYPVVRGGSWGSLPALARVANRNWATPGIRYDYLGLRLVRTNP